MIGKTPGGEGERVPVRGNHAMTTTLKAKQAVNGATHGDRLPFTQIIVKHQAGLVVGEDGLSWGDVLMDEIKCSLHVRAALLLSRHVWRPVRREHIAE